MAAGFEFADPAGLLARGTQARRERRFAGAKEAYTGAVNAAREKNDAATLAKALTRLGEIERDLHQTEAAFDLYRQAVALNRDLEDSLSLAHTVRHLGDLARELKQPALSQPCYEEALAFYRSHPQTGTLDLANTLRGYALLKTALGDRQAAISLWREAGTLYNQVWQEPGSPFTEADLAPGVKESHRQIAILSGSI